MRAPIFNRSLAMLSLALVAGLCAAWAARQHIQNRVQLLEAQARVPMVNRVVAAHDLPAGTQLGSEHLALRSLPASVASSDSIPPERHGELHGTVLRSPLRGGDLVLPAHAMAQQQTAFSSHLATGRRAITMPVDAINSVSGLLQPGDLIDLYVSFEYRRRRITAPLLQGVLVLATGTTTQQAHESTPLRQGAYATVTLDAAPEDAVKLVAARQSGTITAVLRHPTDSVATQKAVRGDLASLLEIDSGLPPAVSKKIPVIYGNKVIATIPGLTSSGLSSPRQGSGLFDLPYAPELVSAWMQSVADAHDAPRIHDLTAGPASLSDAPVE
ncbi:Flp pilus assembly protein CpaB [Pollutimonas nitritireducens]|uniref:Flp pilus assembly protein CpaB n=1 Tax=Pollutimonas nitritireducens TaxID=2045209 RepID=A0A2N4UC05_9BURK|nr:Flp pilus assembly protein CpaB [Pollutimonas nitritireducens]PLC52556.1 Flp pilus assembly protein CpaB [Pollutimonas nitritireducens]